MPARDNPISGRANPRPGAQLPDRWPWFIPPERQFRFSTPGFPSKQGIDRRAVRSFPRRARGGDGDVHERRSGQQHPCSGRRWNDRLDPRRSDQTSLVRKNTRRQSTTMRSREIATNPKLNLISGLALCLSAPANAQLNLDWFTIDGDGFTFSTVSTGGDTGWPFVFSILVRCEGFAYTENVNSKPSRTGKRCRMQRPVETRWRRPVDSAHDRGARHPRQGAEGRGRTPPLKRSITWQLLHAHFEPVGPRRSDRFRCLRPGRLSAPRTLGGPQDATNPESIRPDHFDSLPCVTSRPSLRPDSTRTD